jgi:apolipoprotein D and lipocalin family protein
MKSLSVIAAMLLLAGCQSVTYPPLTMAKQVDLQRFMGDWYVIANIPTFIEKGAHNAVESYRLDADGSIDTLFTFRADSFDGQLKRYNPRGFVIASTGNAQWGMRFIWPFKSDYRIMYLNADYTQTVIGREQRDYVWVMARSPSISDEDYLKLVAMLASEGYDTAKLQKVPQQW